MFKNLNFRDLVAKFNLRVTITGYCATSRYRNPVVAQPPGYDIRILSKQAKVKVSKSLKNNLHQQFPDITKISPALLPQIKRPFQWYLQCCNNLGLKFCWTLPAEKVRILKGDDHCGWLVPRAAGKSGTSWQETQSWCPPAQYSLPKDRNNGRRELVLSSIYLPLKIKTITRERFLELHRGKR